MNKLISDIAFEFCWNHQKLIFGLWNNPKSRVQIVSNNYLLLRKTSGKKLNFVSFAEVEVV